jgi:hypothetical protein
MGMEVSLSDDFYPHPPLQDLNLAIDHIIAGK